MSLNAALREYAQVGVETGVSTADPRRLVVMLYDGAVAAVAQARFHMAGNEIAQKGEKISKAIAIIDGLRAALDPAAGGAIADQLAALYDYMTNRLLMANILNDPAGLEEVGRLLGELKGAWEQIASGAAPVTEAPQP